MADYDYPGKCYDMPLQMKKEENAQKKPMDSVNNPAHYMQGGIETIDIIRELLTPEEFRGYCKGNIIKYRERAPYKGQTKQDYAKAIKYWEWLKGE